MALRSPTRPRRVRAADLLFPRLQLIVFSGHLPDRPDCPDLPSRFPPSAMDEVCASFDRALADAHTSVGMTSAAAGADLLFIGALRRRNADSAFHLILPWGQEEFRRTSVVPFEPAGRDPLWQPMFEDALAQAASRVGVARPAPIPCERTGAG